MFNEAIRHFHNVFAERSPACIHACDGVNLRMQVRTELLNTLTSLSIDDIVGLQNVVAILSQVLTSGVRWRRTCYIHMLLYISLFSRTLAFGIKMIT